MAGHIMGIADGPTEVHKVTLARRVLAKYGGRASDDEHDVRYSKYNLVRRYETAVRKYAPLLKARGVDPKWIAGGGGSGLTRVLGDSLPASAL